MAQDPNAPPPLEQPVDLLMLKLKYQIGRQPTAEEFFSYLLNRAKETSDGR